MAPMALIMLNPLGPFYIPELRKHSPKPPKPKFPPTPLNQTELIRCITAHDCDVTKRSLDIGNDTVSVSHKWGESTVTVAVAPTPDDTLERVYEILESGRLAAEKNMTASPPFLGDAATIPSVPTVAQPNAPFGMMALFGLFFLMALMTLVAAFLVFDDLRTRGATKRRIDTAEVAAKVAQVVLDASEKKVALLKDLMDQRLTELREALGKSTDEALKRAEAEDQSLALRDQVIELSSEMDGLRAEKKSLQKQRDQQERTIAELVASKQLLETETAQQLKRLAATDSLEAPLKAAKAKAEEWEREYTEAAEQLTEWLWKNEALEKEVKGLQKQLKAEQDKGEGASEALARALQENEELKKQLEDEQAPKSQSQADETSNASEDPIDTASPSGAEGLKASRWASEAGPSTADPEKTAAETTLNKNQKQRERDHQKAIEWAQKNPDQVPPRIDRFRRGNNAKTQKAVKTQQTEVKRMIKEGIWQPNEEWKAWMQTEQGIKGMADME
ncbi:hypothetical protein KC315_g13803 [Hortaea werneckii]|nr:hypothetical protein KC315_g13803 [Hortaea werneckii]